MIRHVFGQKMTELQRPHRWERKHINGWITVVQHLEEERRYKCSARPEWHIQNGYWSTNGIADLVLAQKIADGYVPPHDCACSPWMELDPILTDAGTSRAPE
jgi:hypothetical protein